MRFSVFALGFLAGLPSICLPAQSVSDLVHPLIGTAAEGQTFPVAGVPFAMTDWTPQTRDGEVKCVAPYYSQDTRIQGFRGSHFLSGSCTQDYGSFTVMPVSGKLRLGAKERSAAFSHKDESAHPYLYSVDLREDGIHADITGTARSGIMRFRFDHPGESWLVVQTNAHPGKSGGGIHIDASRNEIWGENPVFRIYAGQGNPAGFSGYFVMRFDRSIHDSGIWNPEGDPGRGAYLGFGLKPAETVQVLIGTSFTSVEEARKNLQAEIPDGKFDPIVAQAKAAWEKTLGAIRIAGTAPERSIFYTAIYHSFLLPRTFSDVDGHYPRFAGGGAVETAKGFTCYDDFSLWDTFRAVHPLLTILDPGREGEMVASLVAKGTQGGFLPIFPAWNSYTSEMIGDHADAVIADAFVKGIGGFDVAEAYRLMRRNALVEASPAEERDGRGRRGLTSYLKYGYIPLEDHVPNAFHKDEQVSRTLEYAYDDSLVGTMAAKLGKPEDAALFAGRAGNWRKVIDPAVGFARGRHADGSWVTPFDPGVPATYVTEALPFQYTFFVPQDVPGLIDVLGGRTAFTAKLDTLFAKGYYDHGNEPSHHIAYLYNASGAAFKTQEHVRTIMDTAYGDRVDGLKGNDDAGQISAWYVFSALGFYPVAPGTPVYEIGTPRFDEMTVALPGGHSLHIVAHGTEAGARYIRSLRWNGKPYTRHTLAHDQLMQGGELEFTMSDQPDPGWPGVSP